MSSINETVASDDPSGLIVRKPVGQDSYETVYGQFIAARPGLLRLDQLRSPAQGTDREWTTRLWHAPTTARLDG